MKRQAAYRIYRDVLPGYHAVAAMTQRALAALWIGRAPERGVRDLDSTFALRRPGRDSRFDRLARALEAPLRLGRDLRLPFPLDLWWARPFEAAVYRVLRRTVAGETISYGELARRAGAPGRARQVGRAMARNRILLAIPCHRVVRSDDGLGGFSAGLDLKRRLLSLERAGSGSGLSELQRAGL